MARAADGQEPGGQQPEQDAGGTGEEARARRAERVARMRAQQKRRERSRRLAIVAAAVVAVLAVAGGITAVIASQPDPPSLDAVRSYTYEGGLHTSDPVTYAENPPVGGQHDPTWLNCGIYDAPVRSENAVHSMEHGAVWITYRPDLPESQVTELRNLVQGQAYGLLSPYPDLPSPVVVSAWGKQLQVDSASDKRIDLFLKTYLQGPQTPEPGAACSGGTGTPVQ